MKFLASFLLFATLATPQTVGPSSGIVCYSGTINYSQFKSGAQTRDIFIMNWLPKFRPLHVFIYETEPFASKNSGITYIYSVGRLSAPHEIVPEVSLGSVLPWFDRPGMQLAPGILNALYFHFIAKDTSGNQVPLGDGTSAELAKGNLAWEICGFTVPN